MKEKVSAEKVRIVLERLRGEEIIAELCRCEGIPSNLYYRGTMTLLQVLSGRSESVRVGTIRDTVSLASPSGLRGCKVHQVKTTFVFQDPAYGTSNHSSPRTFSSFGVSAHSWTSGLKN